MDYNIVWLEEEINNLKEENRQLRKRNSELIDEVCFWKYTKLSKIKDMNNRKETKTIPPSKYELFRKRILERDNYTCQECGCKNRLQVHHIISRKQRPDLVMDENNCITLCIVCHAKTDSYLNGNGNSTPS